VGNQKTVTPTQLESARSTSTPAGTRALESDIPAPSFGTSDWSEILEILPEGIVVADENGTVIYANQRLENLLGWAPAKLAGRPVTTLIPERLRAAHERGFDLVVSGKSKPSVGRTLRVTALTAAGAEIPIELAVAFTETNGGQLRLVASIRDANERVDLERQATVAERLLAVVAAGSEDLGERFIEIVGEILEWDIAALWAVEADRELCARGFWHRAGLDAAQFKAETETTRFELGVGLPGRTWRAGEATWLSNLALDDNFPRAQTASQVGLSSGFAFPLRNRHRILGVIELYSLDTREPDPGLLAAMGTIGERLGDLLARAEADRERQRLEAEQQRLARSREFLFQAARALARAGGYLDGLSQLARVAVPSLADLCLIDVISPDGTLDRMVAHHADPARQYLADELRRYPPEPGGRHPSVEVIATGQPRFSADMPEPFLSATTRDRRHLAILRQLGFTSYMSVPLSVPDQVLGALTLVSAGSGRRFGSEDLAIAEELAGHAAAVINRARHHELDRTTIRYLQDSFLPAQLPATEDLEVAAVYLPASDVAVGGDWYDVFPLEEGSCIVIGDVAGHGLRSVAVMAQLRNSVRAFASDDPAPGRILTRLNRMLCRLEPTETATAITATWIPQDRTLLWSSAGHPPPLRCRPGEFAYLTSRLNPLLGARPDVDYLHEAKLLRPGSTVVLYTDGLIEGRSIAIDEAMDQLLDFATGLLDLSPQSVCNDILNWRLERGQREDDICVLAVRLA
jgi:PAS domain S-box-containing protein